jgi:hypothetical protein
MGSRTNSAPAFLNLSASAGFVEWTMTIEDRAPVLATSPAEPAAAKACAGVHQGGKTAAADCASPLPGAAIAAKSPARLMKAEAANAGLRLREGPDSGTVTIRYELCDAELRRQTVNTPPT